MNVQSSTIALSIALPVFCGAGAWPLAALFKIGVLQWSHGPEQTIVPMLAVSMLAGFIVGICTAERSRSKQSPFAEASTRAGFIAAFIAAAVLVARASLHFGRAGHIADAAVSILFISTVTILPATMLAMFMGGLGRAVRLALQADAATGKPAFTFRPVHALYFLCALALLTPFIPSLFQEPPPPVIAAAPTPAPTLAEQSPSKTETPQPHFIYERPSGFDNADATRIAVIEHKTISEVDTEKPMLLSPDGHRFAFHIQNDKFEVLEVFDLDTFTQVMRISLPAPIAGLAWSPDSQRLIAIFQSGDSRSLGVIYPSRGRILSLPRPESPNIPPSTLAWPDEKEVVLHPQSGGKALSLNLDTLEFRTLEDTAFFKALDESKKETIKSPPKSTLPKTAKWALGVGWNITSAGPRLSNNTFELKALGSPSLFVSDSDRGVRRYLPSIPLNMDSNVLFSPDNTKVITLRKNEAAIAYLGLQDAPKAIRRLDMKRRLEDMPQADALKSALAEKRLRAFVYAPFTNPLNDKVVGAEYKQVKASVRFISWTGTTAEVWIQDEYMPLEPTDVAATLHTIEEHAPKAFADTSAVWWVGIGDAGSEKLDAVPLRKDVPELEFGAQLETRAVGQNFTLRIVRPQRTQSPPVARQEPPAEFSQPAPVQSVQTPAPISERAVTDFLNFHHQKSSNNNINGMMNDYADQVEHYKVGVVDHAYIRAEEEKYHAPGFTVFERVSGQINQFNVSPDVVRVGYQLQFLRIAPDTSWTKGVADVTMDIQTSAQGLHIIKQNSVSRDSERQKGKGNPPPL